VRFEYASSGFVILRVFANVFLRQCVPAIAASLLERRVKNIWKGPDGVFKVLVKRRHVEISSGLAMDTITLLLFNNPSKERTEKIVISESLGSLHGFAFDIVIFRIQNAVAVGATLGTGGGVEVIPHTLKERVSSY
jgi:hypothetical protein